MDLVGAWLRQLLRAGTAAAIVPAAIVGALVVALVGAGGFGGLGSLRQVVAGPQISPTEVAAAGPLAPDVAPPARRPRPSRVATQPPRRAVTPPPVVVTPPAVVPPPVTPPPTVTPPPVAPPAPPVVVAPPAPPEQVATPKEPALQQTTQAVVDGVDSTLDTVGKLLVALIDRLGRLLPPPQR